MIRAGLPGRIAGILTANPAITINRPGACPQHSASADRPETRTKTRSRAHANGMLLTNEEGLRRKDPSWPLVERVVRELDQGTWNSFCCLNSPDGSYIQTLHGFNGYHLEWREYGSVAKGYVHWRASYPGGSGKKVELKKHDFVSEGEHRDLLHLDDVVDAFRAFHSGSGMPVWLEWRDLGI